MLSIHSYENLHLHSGERTVWQLTIPNLSLLNTWLHWVWLSDFLVTALHLVCALYEQCMHSIKAVPTIHLQHH